MSTSTVYLLGTVLLLVYAVYKLLLYPIFLVPLAKIPTAHWSACFSTIWIQYWRIKHLDTPKVHEAHQKYGPVVRLAPNELSVNCIEGGLRTIYAGGFEKGSWYSNVFNNYGLRPMFSMEDRATHSRRKRMISNIYAKSTLQQSQSLTAISKVVLQQKLVSILASFADANQIFDIYDIFAAVTMDMVTAYAVGLKNSSCLLDDLAYTRSFTRDFKSRQVYTVWSQDLPVFTSILSKFGLKGLVVPSKFDLVNPGIEEWVLKMCDGAEKTVLAPNGEKVLPEDVPNVYNQLRTNMLREATKSDADLPVDTMVSLFRYELASEIVDHVIAGFDTSSITLTWLAWQLSRPINKIWQQKLQEELSGYNGSDPKVIDSMPVLEAILMETLRLHAAIPGNQPRVTPANATLGPPGREYAGIPADVRVQSQAWSLHRNPDVFPDPDTWQPARWLDASEEQHREMMRWFWAFGSGGRMCIGSNLAIYEMKAIIALIWSRFSTSIEFDEGMIMNGGYQAEPLGKDGRMLEVSLQRIK